MSTEHGDTTITRLWPDPSPAPLTDHDDDGILAAYAPPERQSGSEPFLRANFIASADGAATVNGKSGGLNSPADKRVFDLLRVACDAVMVGAGTLRDEGYGPMVMDQEQQNLRMRQGRTAHPPLIVVSARLDLDPEHPMFRDAPVRPYVLTDGASPADRRRELQQVANVLVLGDEDIDFGAARDVLAEAGLRDILCEGGPHLLGSIAAAGALDDLCLTVAAKVAGAGPGRIVAGPPIEAVDVELRHVLMSQRGELFLRYTRLPR